MVPLRLEFALESVSVPAPFLVSPTELLTLLLMVVLPEPPMVRRLAPLVRAPVWMVRVLTELLTHC